MTGIDYLDVLQTDILDLDVGIAENDARKDVAGQVLR